MEEPDESLRRLMEARLGTTLCGRYTLDELIGIGGMAAVYRGHHRNGNKVAVKVLHLELSAAPHIKGRFLREGYVANKVEHPGAVRVLDDDTAGDGAVFLVMELLEGETLESRIARRQGKLTADEAVPILVKTLEVLSAAHQKQIVHRDIKPENVFLLREGGVKVLDFGIARLLDGSRGMTRTGHFVGTPAYMAPEQARGEKDKVGPPSDVWSVGAMAFRTMSGRFVHEAPSPEMTMIATATIPAPKLVSVAPSVTRELSEIIDRALSLDISNRWPSAASMADALNRWVVRRNTVVPRLFEDPSSTDSEDGGPRIIERPSDLPPLSLEEQTRVDDDPVTILRDTSDVRKADTDDVDENVMTTVEPHPPMLDVEGPLPELASSDSGDTDVHQQYTLPQIKMFESVPDVAASAPKSERVPLPRLQLTDSVDTQVVMPVAAAFRPPEQPQRILRREEPTMPRRDAYVRPELVAMFGPPEKKKSRNPGWERRALFWGIVCAATGILLTLLLVLFRPLSPKPPPRIATPSASHGEPHHDAGTVDQP